MSLFVISLFSADAFLKQFTVYTHPAAAGSTIDEIKYYEFILKKTKQKRFRIWHALKARYTVSSVFLVCVFNNT